METTVTTLGSIKKAMINTVNASNFELLVKLGSFPPAGLLIKMHPIE
jgi:hypothetical protein